MSGFLSRGFSGRRRVAPELAARVPPGQYVETDFPVLTAGPTPRIDPAGWALTIDGIVGQRREWSWDQLHELPSEDVPCDIHCVTQWSKLGTSFRGVSLDVLSRRSSHSGPTPWPTHTAATRRTSRWRIWRRARRGSSGSTRASRCPPTTAAPRGCSCPTCTSGRARSGCRPASPRPRRTGFLGGQRLPQPRRPLEGGALLDRLTTLAPRAPGRWQIATVAAINPETARVSSFRLALALWMPHLPGQHYDVRLTAPDGYTAQRSYWIASSPLDEGEVELTIDRLEEGEVSPYFHDVVEIGDEVEVQRPVRVVLRVARDRAGAGRPRRRRLGGPCPAPCRCCATSVARDPRPTCGSSTRSAAPRTSSTPASSATDDAHLHARPAARLGGAHREAGRAARRRGGQRRDGPAYVCGSNGFVESATRCCSTPACGRSGSGRSASARRGSRPPPDAARLEHRCATRGAPTPRGSRGRRATISAGEALHPERGWWRGGAGRTLHRTPPMEGNPP